MEYLKVLHAYTLHLLRYIYSTKKIEGQNKKPIVYIRSHLRGPLTAVLSEHFIVGLISSPNDRTKKGKHVTRHLAPFNFKGQLSKWR